jgi:acetylglutamate kinase
LEYPTVEQAIGKAATLLEALPYIQQYYERMIVVKLGGSVMDDLQAERELLRDVVFLNYVGVQPIIVHGGGKEISLAMRNGGMEPRFVQGLRYTDPTTLQIAERVLCDQINTRIVATLNELGVQAVGLHSLSSCVLFGEQTQLNGPDGPVDIGRVGRVTAVNDRILRLLCQADTIPVIAPIACDRVGGKLNVNADHAAGEVAAALRAEKLVVLSDTHGVRRDRNDSESFVSTLQESQIKQWVQEGRIDAGMLPKVESCLRALEAGVKKAHIIDGRIAHSLLLEIFTDKGVGTQILK